MPSTLDNALMPADHPTESTFTNSTRGEEVNAVALFESRRLRGTRARDELSQIDRDVLLEIMRQRRRYQALKTQIYSELYGMRINK